MKRCPFKDQAGPMIWVVHGKFYSIDFFFFKCNVSITWITKKYITTKHCTFTSRRWKRYDGWKGRNKISKRLSIFFKNSAYWWGDILKTKLFMCHPLPGFCMDSLLSDLNCCVFTGVRSVLILEKYLFDTTFIICYFIYSF